MPDRAPGPPATAALGGRLHRHASVDGGEVEVPHKLTGIEPAHRVVARRLVQLRRPSQVAMTRRLTCGAFPLPPGPIG